MTVKIFVDSDVVISSLLSPSGAASILMDDSEARLFISDISNRELIEVTKRLKIEDSKLETLLKNKFKIFKLSLDRKTRMEYSAYTLDPNDVHVVVGAKKAKVKFLITYNNKHYKIEKIKQDLNIIVLRPATLLQYLRSRD